MGSGLLRAPRASVVQYSYSIPKEPIVLLDEELTSRILAAAIEVHRELGPGLLESAYERCLCRELELAGIPFHCQVPLPVVYKGVSLDCGYDMDVAVEGVPF